MDGCLECGEPLLWGGTSWVPHTDRQHAATRTRLARGLATKLRARTAARAGHHVTIRFTADWTWFVCACGEHGPLQRDSYYSSSAAFGHLVEAAGSHSD